MHKERRSCSMSRKIYLSDADVDNISAKLENGVLAVTVPKLTQAETVKTINIE
ncbi:MAG: Hsp20 family protein [Christensenellales bacterium]